ncbi:MAG: cysteine--tRNA ligase [Promethearchaeota archaeon]
MLKIYNDLFKKKEIFKPLSEDGKKVKIYVCGPTVYDSPHIGHARAAVSFDILRRYLKFVGYDVKYVSNYTDIDDKMINRANELGMPVSELAEKYIDEYEAVMKDLNVLPPDEKPLATKSIDAIQNLIKLIMKNGFGYESGGSVYFNVEKYAEKRQYDTLFMRKPTRIKKKQCIYEPLGDQNTSHVTDNATNVISEFIEEKKNERDFALWKKAKKNEPSWNSPWGAGRPGWHVECSAMVYKHLGKEIDIHGGGKDLIFPHHSNEIAQTDAAVNTKLARYWLHNGFVNVNNEKMSKSLKNFFIAEDVIKKYGGMILRMFLVSVNYRTPIDYSTDTLDEAVNNYNKIKEFYKTIKTLSVTDNINIADKKQITENLQLLKKDFLKAMEDDLNTAKALSQIYHLIRSINSIIFEDKKELDNNIKEFILNFLIDFSNIFGVILDESVQKLGIWGSTTHKSGNLIIEKEKIIAGLMDLITNIRSNLRVKKMFDLSDKIRDELKKNGIELSDMKGKTLWKFSK